MKHEEPRYLSPAQIKEELDQLLAGIMEDRLTPGEVDELARLDELKHHYNRTPWEI